MSSLGDHKYLHIQTMFVRLFANAICTTPIRYNVSLFLANQKPRMKMQQSINLFCSLFHSNFY